MKKILFLLFILVPLSIISAQDITQNEALAIVKSFVSKASLNKSKRVISQTTSLTLAYKASENSNESSELYVFNKNTNDGFIIVSGDSRANLILGYSDEGNFDYNKLPQNVKNWIADYVDEIDYLRINNIQSANVRIVKLDTTVSPLLGDIAWNQDSPYNDQCPRYDYSTRCATGCVATAMAQIMYYNKWPDIGNGTHTYYPSILNGDKLTANFGDTHYDWATMLPAYDKNSSSQSRAAVAQLMLHCGISVDMYYSSSSGAMAVDVPNALANYFNYDKGVAYRIRSNYSNEEWENTIRNELDAGRPVFVTGYSSAGGHAFVFDGYDSDGLIHVNWGWGKMSNGYFQTTALTPASQGIGGSKGGFNYKQQIVTGIRKPSDETEEDVELISAEGINASSENIANGGTNNISLNGKITNVGWESSNFDFGLLLLNENNDTVKIIKGDQNLNLKKDSSIINTKYNNACLGQLADGEYKLYPVCRKSDGTKQWNRIHDAYVGYPNFLNVIANKNNVSFITPNYFDLKVEKASVPLSLFSTVAAKITTTIVNNGDVEYYGEVKASIYNKTTKKYVAQSAGYMVDINPGDSTMITFTDAYTVPAGDYTIYFTDDDNTRIGAGYNITIKNAPTETAELTPGEQLTFADNNNVDRDSMTIHTKVTCTKGVFGGQMYLFIFDKDGNTQMGCLNPEYIYVEEGDTVDVKFNGSFENGVPGTLYMAYLVKYDGTNYNFLNPKGKSSCIFRLISTTGIINNQSNDKKYNGIYNINGEKLIDKDITNLTHGLYILKNSGKTIKVIK